jgi:hypothetical protein
MEKFGSKYYMGNAVTKHKVGSLVTIDGQVRLIRLQTDNFCLILHQQTDK